VETQNLILLSIDLKVIAIQVILHQNVSFVLSASIRNNFIWLDKTRGVN